MSSEISKTLIQKNLVNIAKKLKDGKTLSRTEIEIVKNTEGQAQKTDADYARQFSCSVKTIQRARAAGAPIEDPEAMSAWFASRKNSPSGTGGKAEQIADAKLEKVLEEIKRIKIKNEIDTKKLIPVDIVSRELIKIGNAFRSELLRIGGDIPNWEGLKAAEMKRRWDEIMERICAELSDQLSEIYK